MVKTRKALTTDRARPDQYTYKLSINYQPTAESSFLRFYSHVSPTVKNLVVTLVT